MIQLSYGCRNGLNFKSEQKFCIVLGVLANNKYTKVVWEHNGNQGAWGSESRIKIMCNNLYLTQYLQSYFTAGVGNILNRVNCNPYIEYLNLNFGIQNDNLQKSSLIRNIMQRNYPQYLANFDLGYNS